MGGGGGEEIMGERSSTEGQGYGGGEICVRVFFFGFARESLLLMQLVVRVPGLFSSHLSWFIFVLAPTSQFPRSHLLFSLVFSPGFYSSLSHWFYSAEKTIPARPSTIPTRFTHLTLPPARASAAADALAASLPHRRPPLAPHSRSPPSTGCRPPTSPRRPPTSQPPAMTRSTPAFPHRRHHDHAAAEESSSSHHHRALLLPPPHPSIPPCSRPKP
uniref:Uncharacterized protein n=1 Tax=Aegilops tauschii subsp. strangulata TaxID=200361 RepID=A0A453IV70_AEGTS